MLRLSLSAALAATVLATPALAAPQFAKIFTDHAVIQRDQPVTVWGTATPSQAVTVSLNGQSATATADAAGKWRATLPAMTAGGPFVLTAAAGGETATRNDILVGDVYLCSGQSNMEFSVRNSTNAWGALMGAGNNNIRFANIQKDSQPLPLDDLTHPTEWKVSGPDVTGDASAVCYYMARSLQARYQVPVGFINSSWGGTTIESWVGPSSLKTVPAFAEGVAAVDQLGTNPAKAMADEEQRQEAWWDAHDKNAKAERAYISPKYDDAKWPSLTPVGSWKAAGIDEFKSHDGVSWFRTTVELTQAQAATANQLVLGPIDTYDTAWVNGTRVGGASMSWMWREYNVPKGVFKAGTNIVVLRVLSGGWEGGLTGRPENRAVKTSDGQYIQLKADWKYKLGMASKGLSVPPAPWNVPTSLTTLYNGMIAPLKGYHLKLAAWYQGEANVGRGEQYRTLQPLLIKDWRETFGQPDMPFLVTQLTAFGSTASQPVESGWAELREAQRLSIAKDPHAFTAITIDFGDRSDIHPTQKTIVGERLARAARVVAYGDTSITPGGPEAISATRSGNDIVVAFKSTNGGLRTYSSDLAIGFEACAGGTCHYVAGSPSGDTVVLKGAGAGVTKVRYAWADSPFVNLFSADDLPAAPFELTVQ
ncbi:hypothetical protein ABAC460_22955 [Asticcacaulis sp. AC460]|uniref:sialate O-acetylesterase n=1 Tax=Asticcacaulis sp. AC460 TaxID=1282360 RepID=UPI0003C3F240|nr:sialate O-acetylesterase [Asticcacaulis sp. AC460]ESQ86576.1 hypothetical protein ABAC460_22955 [Asticcacaulis sp. AC460]